MSGQAKQEIIDFYSERASEWSELMMRQKIGRVRNEEIRFIQSHLNILPKGGRILDVGIGAEAHERVIAEKSDSLFKSFKWSGIDLVDKMLIEGKKSGLPIALWQVDAIKLPFASESFDCCISEHVFSLISDEELPEVFDNITRVLNPNGLLIACVYTPPDYTSNPVFLHRYPQYKDKYLREKEMSLNQWRPFSEYENLLNQARFEIIAKLPLTYDAVQLCAVKR